MRVPAIDLGKVKNVACDYQSETAEYQSETVRTVAATVEHLGDSVVPSSVVIELGPLAG